MCVCSLYVCTHLVACLDIYDVVGQVHHFFLVYDSRHLTAQLFLGAQGG